MLINSLSQQSNAHLFNQQDPDQIKDVEKIKLQIEKRVESVDPEELSDTKDNIMMLLNDWATKANYHKTNLKYREPSNENISTKILEAYTYLLKTDVESKQQLIPVPVSLRNAEQEHNLRYLDLQEEENEDE